MIKFVVFDFDGVFTDGKFYFDNSNNIKKCYNAKDAYSLKILKEYDIKCGIITNDKVISIEHAPHIFDRLDKVSLGSDKPKLDILDIWLKEYGYSYKEVAYIGDDLPDIPVLEKVRYSGCPNDAIDDVKKVSQYICKNKGGEGAVREFVDSIIKNNISESEINDDIKVNNDGKITAVIPVRKGSTRCKNKNIRKFGDTNLLKLKIETLKKVKGIDKILVSSNCDIMLGIAKNMGVDIHKRDEKYSNSTCTGTDLNLHLAKLVSTEYFMRVSIMTPFIISHYDNCINLFINGIKTNQYDSVNTVNISQHFTWNDKKPINYNYENEVPSFQLPKWHIPNFGINIIKTANIIKYKNIIGKNPYFYQTDLIEGIDIDYPSDFLITEMLYNNDIINEHIGELVLEKRDNDKIELLDCTIRDGGYLNNWDYSIEEVKDCYNAVTNANYNYFEIGFKANKEIIKNKGRWYYSEEIDVKKVKESSSNGCKIAVLLKPGDININDIPHNNDSNIDLYRVLINRSTKKMDKDYSFYTNEAVEESCHICQELINKGYEVTINIGCFDNITKKEIELICNNVSKINGIKVIYLADTYGSGNSKNIPIQLHNFYLELEKYKSSMLFGFHCHNNNEDAIDKTKMAIFHGCKMIDSCIGGLGRGSGNLKSEQLLSYIYPNKIEYIKYITPLIKYFDKYILSKKEYKKNKYIQAHPYYMISSVLSLHPNYIIEILEMDNDVINDIELIIKLDTYTIENNCRDYDKNLINLRFN